MNKRTKNILWLGVCLSPFVLGISTVNAVKGLSTDPALQMNMSDSALEWIEYAKSQQSDPAAARSVQSTIEPLKESICSAAKGEAETGLLSGSPGRGPLYGAYNSVCASLTSTSNSVGEAAQRNAFRQDNITTLGQQLLAIPERDNVAVLDRQDEFKEVVADFERLLADGKAENLRETVKTQFAIAANAVVVLETEDNDFGAKQRAAIESLKAQLTSAKDIFDAFLTQEGGGIELQKPEPLLTSGGAIARYWPRLIPQILAAIGVDLSILWLAAFLAVSRAARRDAEGQLLHKPHWLDVGNLPPWPDEPDPSAS